ncbi:MAG: penicillin-insensitive murein endopeptidase [Elusimicrobia bacterium]|nr:penicillin-insensitive murein endopeptidase [Elusimicrobiota bacterium]
MKAEFKLSMCLILFASVPSFSAEPVVNFDGISKGVKDLKAFISENIQTSTTPSIIREIQSEPGKWVELKPAAAWNDLDGGLRQQFEVFPGMAVRWHMRCPKGKWSAKISYDMFPDQIGGHYHYDMQPSPLFATDLSVTPSTSPFHSAPSPITLPEMQGNTTYYYWQGYPAFATRIVEHYEASGACQFSQSDYIDVMVKGLLDMPSGNNYVLDDSQDVIGYHPDTHYGMQVLIDTLTSVANSYKATFPDAEPLHIEDMSLPWGGIIDTGYNWNTPHAGHTIGADADINRDLIPQQNREKLLEIMCALTPGVYLEQDTSADIPHFHLRVYGRNVNELQALNQEERRVLPCCNGNSVDPANLNACVSYKPPLPLKR